MANFLYPKYRERILGAGLNLTTEDVRAVLVDVGGGGSQYTAAVGHEFLSSVPAGARYGTPQSLASKTITDGVFDAADITFPALTAPSCEAIILYAWSGADAGSRLIAYIDTAGGLPVTPAGNTVPITWHATGIIILGTGPA